MRTTCALRTAPGDGAPASFHIFRDVLLDSMIGLKSTLNVIDNSGALLVECVNVLKNKVRAKEL